MKSFLAIAIVLGAAVALGLWFDLLGLRQKPAPANFAECAAAGYPVAESYPRQCRADGRTFVEDIGSPDVSDLIRVTAPLPDALIGSPLLVAGEARGNWYFEASFPVELHDAAGELLAIAPAQAQGEWMTTEFVPFELELDFQLPSTDTGMLILHKDNPSGLPEFDASISIPVRFR